MYSYSDISLLFTDGTKIDIKPEVIDKFNNELNKGEVNYEE